MKKFVVCIALLSLVALSGQAAAELCTIDARPAATLLLPYFAVDLDNPNGLTTLFSINNASAAPQLAHVTVWTDWSIPVFDFDVYLTGYDVQTMNLRDVLAGVLPQTGENAPIGVAQPGSDPWGPFSDPNVPFTSCNNSSSPGAGPYYEIPAFGDTFRAHVEAWLTGNASPLSGDCAGVARGNNVAVGYITVDNTNQCSLFFPSDHSAEIRYFGETGIATDNNVLWGDYIYVDRDNNFAQGDTLVHVEADPIFEDPQLSPSTEGITFYGRYVDRVTEVGIDHREPLPTTLASRFAVGGGFDGGTDLIAWRSAENASASPVTCGSAPGWVGLNQREAIIFNEIEEAIQVEEDDCVSGDPTCEVEIGNLFPYETQVRAMGENPLQLEAGFEFGWIYMNLNHNRPGNVYTDRAQAWVTTVMSAEERYSVGYQAIQLDNACDPNDFVFDPDFVGF